MATDRQEIRNLQEGSYVMMEGEPCEINSYSTAKPGKHGSAKARVEATGLFDERKRTLSQPVDAQINVPIVDRQDGQIVSTSGDEIQVMNLDTYETFRIKLESKEHGYTPDDNIEFIEFEERRKIVE